MAILNENENKNIRFSSGKRWVSFTNGNLKIEYLESERKYKIIRTDGKTFDDNTIYIGAMFMGNMKAPETLDEIVEYEVNTLTCMQIEPEVALFNEFDWAFNEDKTEIIVFPVFLEEGTNVIVSVPYPFGSSVEMSFGTVKRVRNGNIGLDNVKSLNLKKN